MEVTVYTSTNLYVSCPQQNNKRQFELKLKRCISSDFEQFLDVHNILEYGLLHSVVKA